MQKARIMVVDNNAQLADELLGYLQKLGYEGLAAHGSREALVQFKKGGFHLVITDLKMPEIDGIQLLEILKTIDKKVLIVVISGYGTFNKALEALKKGAFDFIPKPFKLQQLKIIVAKALNQHPDFMPS
jgi:DNA-binding NtrC family response regulator